MARHLVLSSLLLIFAAVPLIGMAPPAQARVDVNIGINVPAPPQLLPVPSTPAVAYAPGIDANFFHYDGQYYVFANGVWYVSRGYNGPWVVLAPEYVPPPLLGVPVQYYHRPPTAWREWRRDTAPRWAPHYGQRWDERRYEGQASPRGPSEEHRGDGRDGRGERDGHQRDGDRHEERR